MKKTETKVAHTQKSHQRDSVLDLDKKCPICDKAILVATSVSKENREKIIFCSRECNLINARIRKTNYFSSNRNYGNKL